MTTAELAAACGFVPVVPAGRAGSTAFLRATF